MLIEEAPSELATCNAAELPIDTMVGCAQEAARLLKLLAEALNLSQSALSQHLAKLRRDGLVQFRRESQTLHYRLADPRAIRVLLVLKEIFCPQPSMGDHVNDRESLPAGQSSSGRCGCTR